MSLTPLHPQSAVSEPGPAPGAAPTPATGTLKLNLPTRVPPTSSLSTPFLDSALGKYVTAASTRLHQADDFASFLRSMQPSSDLHPDVGKLPHPAAPLLLELRNHGANLQLETPPWSLERRQAAVSRGPHRSSFDHIEFVHQDFADMVAKGFWVVLPVSDIIHLEDVRFSPLGVVPQRERRPRVICDYSFYDINQECAQLAPAEAMQFGKALLRVIYQIVHANPKYGPTYLAKYDLSDGYYRVQLSADIAACLTVLLPTAPGEEPLAAVPLTLPMGWSESPAFFCAATETAADLANATLQSTKPVPPHRLETEATKPVRRTVDHPRSPSSPRPVFDDPIAYTDVYLDDLIGVVQGSDKELLRLTRVILHSIDRIFRPLEPTDRPQRQEPISLKKLLKGDGQLSTQKEILGWMLDTVACTLSLTTRRYERLLEILDTFPRTRKRVSVGQWRKVLGELRSMSIALPGSRGLFGPLQHVLRPEQKRLHLTNDAHDFLDDFRWVAHNLHERPTSLYELVPGTPIAIGSTDAAGHGLGGVVFLPTTTSTPSHPSYVSFVWRAQWPEDITRDLVSFDNPSGRITNSDLELAASNCHLDVCTQLVQVAEATLVVLHDNTPALYWSRKGSATTTGPAAYLLRLRALHQRHHRYIAQHDFIPGVLNCMADDASRLHHLSDTEFLSHMNSRYPQSTAWQLYTLRSETLSAMTSALRKRRSAPESWLNDPEPPPPGGDAGWSSVPNTPWTPTSPKETILYRTSKFSQLGTAMDASHPAANPYDLAQLWTPFVTSVRRTQAWGPVTSDSTPLEKSTSASIANSART